MNSPRPPARLPALPRPAWRAGAAGLLVLALAACADAGDPAPAAPEPAAEPDAVGPVEVRPGVRLDRILAAHGDTGAFLAGLRPPRSTRTEPVENEHVAGQVDTVRTHVYDGLRIEAYEVAGGPTFVQAVTVTGGGYGTASGLAVGESRADLEAVLGPPVRQGGAAVVYETGDGATPTAVEVRYGPDADGTPRASEITWRPTLD